MFQMSQRVWGLQLDKLDSDLCFSIQKTFITRVKAKVSCYSVTYSMSTWTGLLFFFFYLLMLNIWLLWPFYRNVCTSDAGLRWQQIISNQRRNLHTGTYFTIYSKTVFRSNMDSLKVIFCTISWQTFEQYDIILRKNTPPIHCHTVTQTF